MGTQYFCDNHEGFMASQNQVTVLNMIGRHKFREELSDTCEQHNTTMKCVIECGKKQREVEVDVHFEQKEEGRQADYE